MAALWVATIGPLTTLLLLAGVVFADLAAGTSGDVPWQMLLPPFGIAAVTFYVAGAMALFITTELLAFIATPTTLWVHGFALLPGGLMTLAVLDLAQLPRNGFSSFEVLMAAMVPLLIWQALLRAWWALAKRLSRRHRHA